MPAMRRTAVTTPTRKSSIAWSPACRPPSIASGPMRATLRGVGLVGELVVEVVRQLPVDGDRLHLAQDRLARSLQHADIMARPASGAASRRRSASSNGSQPSGSAFTRAAAMKLCTLTPSSRTGRDAASVRSSRATARRSMPSPSCVGAVGVAARNGREVAVTQLERDGARAELAAQQPGGRVARHLGDLVPHLGDVGEVGWRTCSRCPTTSASAPTRPGGRRGRAPAASASRRASRPRRAAAPDRRCARRSACDAVRAQLRRR